MNFVMKHLLATLLFLGTVGAHAATYYGFKIGGVAVNSDNYFNVRGSNIKANDTDKPYSVSYDPETNVVTLNNVKIERTGNDNRCIFNEECEGLTVLFEGANSYLSSTTCAPIRLNASTTFTCSALIQANVYGSDGDANCLYATNGATVTFDHATFVMNLTGNSNSAISASSTTDESIVFHHSRMFIRSANGSALTRFSSVNCDGSALLFRTGSETAYAVSGVNSLHITNFSNLIVGYNNSISSLTGFSYSGTATFSTSKLTFVDSSDQPLPGKDIVISQCIAIDETNFPDATFRTWLTGKYGTTLETYEIFGQRTIDIEASGNGSLNRVEDWTGIRFFTCFRRLWDQGGRTKKLPLGSKEFYHLKCYDNPVGIQWGILINSLPLKAPSGKEAVFEGFNTVAAEHNPLPTRSQLGFLLNKGYEFIVKNEDQTYKLNAMEDFWPIDYDHFPDDAFRTYLYGTGEGYDAVIYDSENAKINGFDIKNCNISDLTGIEGFTNIQHLYCYQNKLTTLNLSQNSKLTLLYCYWNKIKSDGWDEFIANAPAVSTRLDVYCYYPSMMENNEPPTYQQVAQAKAKKIHFYQFVNYKWEEMSDTPTAIRGDVNGDGRVNVSDVTALINMILGITPVDQARADVNGDNKVNVSDVTALINIILGVS